MVATVIVTVATHNLAIGVGVGVLAAMVMCARRVAHFLTVEAPLKPWRPRNGDETTTYAVDGELFFASSNGLYTQFEYAHDPEQVIIDLHASHPGTPPPSPHSAPGTKPDKTTRTRQPGTRPAGLEAGGGWGESLGLRRLCRRRLRHGPDRHAAAGAPVVETTDACCEVEFRRCLGLVRPSKKQLTVRRNREHQ